MYPFLRRVMVDQQLEGKSALVTGASSGIGMATARTLASEGARVALAARRENRLHDIADRIEDDGGDATVIPTDITDEDAVVDMVETADTEFGSLDILVNNAGVMRLEPSWRADRENWRQMIEVNLLGMMNTCHVAVPIMYAKGGGHIVNISSTAGRRASPGATGYTASKFGVTGFSEALRQEVTENDIRVTVVEPGAVETELQNQIPDDDIREQAEQMMEQMRVLDPEDVADAIRYTVSRPKHVSINELLIRPTDQRRQ